MGVVGYAALLCMELNRIKKFDCKVDHVFYGQIDAQKLPPYIEILELVLGLRHRLF